MDIDIRKAALIAPYDGIVGSRMVDEGTVVSAGAPVVSLLETARPQARIGLPPAVAASLDADREYQVETASGKVTARLVSQRPDLQTDTRTVPVLFDLETTNGLPFQEIVTLELDSVVDERGAWLPLSALKEGRKGLWSVLIVDEGSGQQQVRSESVEVMHLEGERVFVRGTFSPGARIVTNGTHRIVSGQHVAVTGG